MKPTLFVDESCLAHYSKSEFTELYPRAHCYLSRGARTSKHLTYYSEKILFDLGVYFDVFALGPETVTREGSSEALIYNSIQHFVDIYSSSLSYIAVSDSGFVPRLTKIRDIILSKNIEYCAIVFPHIFPPLEELIQELRDRNIRCMGVVTQGIGLTDQDMSILETFSNSFSKEASTAKTYVASNGKLFEYDNYDDYERFGY